MSLCICRNGKSRPKTVLKIKYRKALYVFEISIKLAVIITEIKYLSDKLNGYT